MQAERVERGEKNNDTKGETTSRGVREVSSSN